MRGEARFKPRARIRSLEAASIENPEILDEDTGIAGMEPIVRLRPKQGHEVTR
jgi:hypothetical protein